MAVSTGTAILGAAGIGALSGKKGGGSTNTTTVQNSEPWEHVQPYLKDLFARGQGLFYDQGQAQGLMTKRALDPNSLTGQAQGQLGATLSGQYLSPESNPHLRASVQDALGLAGSAFAKQYGGAAGQNLGNSGYQEALARGLGATATNAYANAYGQERQNQLNAMQLAPSLGNADLSQLAAAEQMPWQRLAGYQAALSGHGGGASSGSQQTPYFTNPLATAMGMGIGGLSLYNGMNQAGLFGSPASAGTGMSMLGSFPTFA
jgi:hypothetical protein